MTSFKYSSPEDVLVPSRPSDNGILVVTPGELPPPIPRSEEAPYEFFAADDPEQLATGGVSVDERFLKRISKIKVRPPVPGSKRRRSIKLHEQRAWLISVHPLDQNRHKSEREVVEKEKQQAAKRADFTDSGHGYIRFIGTSMFRKYARPGDIVMTISLPRAKSTRATVYAPEPLLHRKDEGRVTHVFVEEYADREDTAVSFTDFSKLWRSTSSLKPPTRRSMKEIDLELAETLRQKMQRSSAFEPVVYGPWFTMREATLVGLG